MGLLGLAKGQSGRRHVLQVCVCRCKYVFSRSPLREVVLRREVSAGAHLSLHRMAVVELRVSLEVHLELGHALFAVLEASGRLLLLLRSEGGCWGCKLATLVLARPGCCSRRSLPSGDLGSGTRRRWPEVCCSRG